MSTPTIERYTPLLRSIQDLKAAAAHAARTHEQHGPASDREAMACNLVMDAALGVAIMAAELEGNADDPASRLLARMIVAENATAAAKAASPLPLDSVTAYVHAAAHLLEMAGEEFCDMAPEPRRG